METNSKEIIMKIKNKRQLYDILAKIYYLPAFDSRAISKEYLLKYVLKIGTIFFMKKTEVVHHNFRYRKFSSSELLDLLEKMLKEKNFKNTGLDYHTLPNQEWLLNAILHLDESDPYQLISAKKEDQVNFTLQCNPEVLEALKDEPITKGRSTIFTTPKKNKDSDKLQRLSKKIQKKEKRLEILKNSAQIAIAAQKEYLTQKKLVEENIKSEEEKIDVENKNHNLEDISKTVEEILTTNFMKDGKVTPLLLEKLNTLYLTTPSKVFKPNCSLE